MLLSKLDTPWLEGVCSNSFYPLEILDEKSRKEALVFANKIAMSILFRVEFTLSKQ
ncbi:MAG: hypothetical protein ACRCSV_03455 [Chlamydiales bacterium]